MPKPVWAWTPVCREPWTMDHACRSPTERRRALSDFRFPTSDFQNSPRDACFSGELQVCRPLSFTLVMDRLRCGLVFRREGGSMRIGRSHFVFRTSHLFPTSDFRLPISKTHPVMLVFQVNFKFVAPSLLPCRWITCVAGWSSEEKGAPCGLVVLTSCFALHTYFRLPISDFRFRKLTP